MFYQPDENGTLVFPEIEDSPATTLGAEMTNSCGTFTVTDVPTQEADKKDLSYHNTARAAHSAGPLFWNS